MGWLLVAEPTLDFLILTPYKSPPRLTSRLKNRLSVLLSRAESSLLDLSTCRLHRGPGQEHRQGLVSPRALNGERRVGMSRMATLDKEGRAQTAGRGRAPSP